MLFLSEVIDVVRFLNGNVMGELEGKLVVCVIEGRYRGKKK